MASMNGTLVTEAPPPAKPRRFGRKSMVGLALTAVSSIALAGASYMKGGPRAAEVARQEGEEAGRGKQVLSEHEREIRGLNHVVRILSRDQLELKWNLRAHIEANGGRWRAAPSSELDEVEADAPAAPELLPPARLREKRDGGP